VLAAPSARFDPPISRHARPKIQPRSHLQSTTPSTVPPSRHSARCTRRTVGREPMGSGLARGAPPVWSIRRCRPCAGLQRRSTPDAPCCVRGWTCNPPLQGRFLAAVKACGSRGVLSHFSAAALWTFLDWEDRYPEVTVSGPATRIHPGLRVHRTSAFDCRDVTRHEGIPVTAPARTMLDLASVLDFRPLRRAVR